MSNYEPNPNRESQQGYFGINKAAAETAQAYKEAWDQQGTLGGLINAQNCANIGPPGSWSSADIQMSSYGCAQREKTKAEIAEDNLRQRREMALQVIARFGDDADKAKATAFLARVAADILQRNDGP